MYSFNNRTYKSIKRLYYTEFINIVTNINFDIFCEIIKKFGISDYCDSDGLKVGAIRENEISEDEIELLNDDELLFTLNRCLINGYKIDKL